MTSRIIIISVAIFVVIAFFVVLLFVYNTKRNMNFVDDAHDKDIFINAQEDGLSSDVIDGVYGIDKEKSNVDWIGRAGGKKHFGSISLSEGKLVFVDGNLESGSVTADMTRITNTDLTSQAGNKLIAHLRSDDFFAVADYPTSQLTIKHIEKKDNSAMYMVTADLKIKDITHEIMFDARIENQSGSVSFDALFDIDRTLWDVSYGIDSVGDKVKDLLIDKKITFDVTIIGLKM